MFHRCTLLVAVLVARPLWVISPRADAQSGSVNEIVARNYPTTRLEPQEAADGRTCHKVMATTAEGAPAQIVAGYTDTSEVVLRVLQRDASGLFQVVYESPTDLMMDGMDCEVSLVDIDGDSVKDVYFEAIDAKGSRGWVFRSTPTELENRTPIDGTEGSSDLKNAGPIDLYHDGTLQIATAGGAPVEPRGRVIAAPALYRMVAGAMTLDGRTLLVKTSNPMSC